LVIAPEVPRNACSFLLAGSIKLIRRDPRWECLVTFADTWQGHTGSVYLAANWQPAGETVAEDTWVDPVTGRMVARKAGGHTRTKAEMEALGYVRVGRFVRKRFVYVLKMR